MGRSLKPVVDNWNQFSEKSDFISCYLGQRSLLWRGSLETLQLLKKINYLEVMQPLYYNMHLASEDNPTLDQITSLLSVYLPLERHPPILKFPLDKP